MADNASNGHPQPKFVSVKDAAVILNVHPRFIYEQIDKGLGPTVVYLNNGKGQRRTIRIRYDDLMTWINERSSPGGKEKCTH